MCEFSQYVIKPNQDADLKKHRTWKRLYGDFSLIRPLLRITLRYSTCRYDMLATPANDMIHVPLLERGDVDLYARNAASVGVLSLLTLGLSPLNVCTQLWLLYTWHLVK